MCKVWGVATRKGGVGKTTTSTTMAYLLAKAGYKVALIDFDGQRHSTKLSGVMLPEKLPITIYEILSSFVLRCKAESDCCIMVADSFRGGMANGGFNKIL